MYHDHSLISFKTHVERFSEHCLSIAILTEIYSMFAVIT